MMLESSLRFSLDKCFVELFCSMDDFVEDVEPVVRYSHGNTEFIVQGGGSQKSSILGTVYLCHIPSFVCPIPSVEISPAGLSPIASGNIFTFTEQTQAD
jgi:hypothetical protein